jgi:hypothetical protein
VADHDEPPGAHPLPIKRFTGIAIEPAGFDAAAVGR